MSLLTDEKRRYMENVRNYKGKMAEWDKMDILTRLLPIMGQYFIDPENGKITTRRAPGWNTPWIHVKGINSKHCGLDHAIKFEHLNYIPPRCLQCWKVVVGPKNLDQLHKLLDIEKSMDVPCKCGIELREYTPRNYGGYFYCESIDQGRERYEQVRKAVDEHMDPDTPVILKRGCTEYEMKLGPSPLWTITDREKEMDEIIDDRFDSGINLLQSQTDYVLALIKKRWTIWAAKNNDQTYLKYNGGEPLYPDYVKYHEGDLNGIKDELALAETVERARKEGRKLDPVAFAEWRELLKKYKNESGQDIGDMLKAADYFNDIPQVIKRDLDESV